MLLVRGNREVDDIGQLWRWIYFSLFAWRPLPILIGFLDIAISMQHTKVFLKYPYMVGVIA